MRDLIDRDDLLQQIQLDSYGNEGSYGDTWKFIETIVNMPSVQSERKKGHWTGDCCSVCGVSKYNYFTVVSRDSRPFGTWHFCPRCGADMR